MKNFENIKKNIEKYSSLLGRFNDKNIDEMVEQLAERLATSPASFRKEDLGCSEGGFLETTFETLRTMKKIQSVIDVDAPSGSLYKVALLHDLGKIGSSSQEFNLPQDSDWHREKLGHIYKKNQDLQDFHPVQLTFQILSSFGIKLTEDEYNAILSIKFNRPLNDLGKLLLAAKLLVGID